VYHSDKEKAEIDAVKTKYANGGGDAPADDNDDGGGDEPFEESVKPFSTFVSESKRGYKEWAKHLRPKGKRAASKQDRQSGKKGLRNEAALFDPNDMQRMVNSTRAKMAGRFIHAVANKLGLEVNQIRCRYRIDDKTGAEIPIFAIPKTHRAQAQALGLQVESLEPPMCEYCGVRPQDDAHAPYCGSVCAIDAEND
jgi:hypothetical protein